MGQLTHTAKHYAELTDAQLAADLLRWADVRDGINKKTELVDGKEVPVEMKPKSDHQLLVHELKRHMGPEKNCPYCQEELKAAEEKERGEHANNEA